MQKKNPPSPATTARKRAVNRISFTIYAAVLMFMVYDWPHQVYRKVGPPMSVVTAREQFIAHEVTKYAQQLDMVLKPHLVVGPVPASAGALSGNAVIVVSPAMLDIAQFSDNEIRYVLAHEVGHLARLDAYRFWTKWNRDASAAKEFDADRIAVRLVGCGPMQETVARHWNEFVKGFEEEADFHPHPTHRLAAACGPGATTAAR